MKPVIDIMSDRGMIAEDLDDLVISGAELQAAIVNNQGIPSQLDYLMNTVGYTAEQICALLHIPYEE